MNYDASVKKVKSKFLNPFHSDNIDDLSFALPILTKVKKFEKKNYLFRKY